MEGPEDRREGDAGGRLSRELKRASLMCQIRRAIPGGGDSPRLGARPLGASPGGFDPIGHAREEGRRRARVAFARELAVILAGAFPREVIIQIHLWVFWG